MNQMTIDCPSCASPLLVPEAAAGRKARCTECDTRFIIPSMQEMLEQTVSHMVLEELDHRWNENQLDMPEAQPSAGNPAQRPDYPTSNSGTVLGIPAVTADSPNDASGVLSVDNLDQSPPTASTSASIATHSTPPCDKAYDDADREPSADPEASESAYPQDLRLSLPRPYLVVKDVSMKGVLLAFAAEWLSHEVFRTSMPIRCVFSGKGPEAKLTSRPMVFANRCTETGQQARALEMRYEHGLGAKHSPREHVRSIGRMDGLPKPFDLPVLYYSTGGHTGDAMACTAHLDGPGREHCEIRIPHGPVAAEWVSRVNGRCGPEYALLKTAVANLATDAWSELSDQCRQRLETWCRFERGERFKLYLNDADLTAADAGLGGVVVTDRRLLYHKFRRSRSLSLNQDAVLHLRTDERHVRLTLESNGRLARAGKIQRQDMDKLIQALADAPRLRVTVGQRKV